MTVPRRIVVLGGGACGLTAAWRLSQAGAEVTVLEQESRIGGLCGTHERNGFRFDYGGHRFITKNPAIDALTRRLMGQELLLRTRSSVILHGGERYRYPLELDDVLRRFGVRRGARAIASFAQERLRRSTDRSFEDWVVHRFGRDLYETFFGPYTEKLWGIPPSEISADWASQRISLLSLSDVLWRLVGLRRGRARTYARRYLYPRLGIGQIFEHMAKEFAAQGGALRLGARVTGMAVVDRRVRGVRYADEAGEHELPCDAVISTISLATATRLVAGKELSRTLARSCEALRFRAIRLLNILLRGPEVSPHTWMYVSEPRYLPARIQEPRHRSPAMAPAGCTSLMLEIPCQVGDERWSAPDGAIYERCLEDLAALGLPDLRGRTIDYFSSFVREGYPIYHLDYQRDRHQLLGFLGDIDNLMSCGRQGSFRYIFMDTAMEMGIRAAEILLAGGAQRGAAAELGGETGLIESRALTA